MSTTSETIIKDNIIKDLGAMMSKIPKEMRWTFMGILATMPNYISWNVFILTTSVLNYILVTTNLCFLPNKLFEFLPFYIIFDVIYLFNFLLLLSQKFFNVTNTKRTVFIIFVADFISLAPQVILLIPFPKVRNSFLVTIFRILTFVRLRNFLIFNKILRRLTDYRVFWFMVQYITAVFIIIHTGICVWYLIRSEEHFYDQLFIVKSENSTSLSEWYFYHTYAYIQILLNVGFGDVYPTNIREIYFFTITFLIGQTLIVYLICYITWYIINYSYHNHYIHHQVRNVKKYLNEVPPIVKLKVDKYFSMNEHKRFKDRSLLNMLPRPLKQDIDYDLNCGILHRSVLLRNLPKYILKKVSSEMKTVILPAGEIIYFQYVVKSCMVGVEDGVLEVLHDDDEESSVVYLRKGTILGELALFMNIPSKVTVRTAKNSELKLLEKQDFLKVMLHFPQQLKYLQATLKMRILKANREKQNSKTRIQNLRKIKDQLSFDSVDDNNTNEANCYGLYKLLDQYSQSDNFNETKWMNIWKLTNGLIQILFCILYFYYVVFVRNVPYYVFAIEVAATIACILDLVLQYHSYKQLQESPIGILTVLDIKLNRWKFNLDIFSLLPVEIWAFVFENIVASNRFYDLFKINRLLRLHRISDVIHITMGPNHFYMVSNVLKTCMFMILAVYFLSCILYVNSCLYTLCDDTGWYFLSSKETYPDNQEPNIAFVNSFYFTMSAAFYTGLGDFLPKSVTDILLVTAFLVAFLFAKSYLYGQLIALTFLNELCSGSLKTKYYLKSFSDLYRVSKPFKQKIINYLKINPNFLRESSKIFFHKYAPSAIETLIQTSQTTNIEKGPLFENIDSYFLALIEKNTKIWLLPKNETLYTRGDPTRIMFIIIEGFCKIYNSKNDLEKTVGPGSYLGYLEAIYSISKKHNIVTKTDCKLLCLEYSVLEKIFKLFPKELDFFERTKYREELVEKIRKLEKVECETPFIGHIDIEEKAFINLNKPGYFKPYKSKLGPFRYISLIFLPTTIHPEGLFIRVWCVLRALLITIQGTVIMLLIMLPPFANELSWMEFICQLSLYLDMYLCLHLGYYDGTGLLKIHPVYTAWHYLTHGFLLDVIAAIPWPLFMFYNQHGDIGTYCFWNFLKLTQFIKVYKCLSYFQNRTFESFGSIRILKSVLFLIVIINFLSSLGLNYFCNYTLLSNEINNLSLTNELEGKQQKIHCTDGVFQDTWMPKFPGVNEIYVAGMYVSINLLTNTGIGDIIGATASMKIATVLIIVLGYFIFAIITVKVCSIMLTDAEKSFKFREQINLIFKFLEINQIPPTIKKQIMKHFDMIWNRTHGFNIESKEHISSDNYINNILFLQRNEILLKSIPLFPNLNENYLRILLNQMKTFYFQKGETIIRYKDVISDIYIVVFGLVDICNKNGEIMITLGAAGVFGNIGKNLKSLSTILVKARSNVEIWALDTETFLNTISYYPIVLKDFEEYFKEPPYYLVAKTFSQFGDFDSTRELEDLKSETRTDGKLDTNQCIKNLFLPNKWFQFSLNSNHFLFKVVDLTTLLASLLNVYFIPYIFVTQDRSMFGYLYLFLEPIFYLRIFLKLHKAYTNIYGNIVYENAIICRKYLNNPGEIFWDLVPNLPVGLLCFIFQRNEWFFFYSSFRILHLLRFHYIVAYFDQQLNNLNRRTRYYLARLIIYYSALVHVLTCIWYMLACPSSKCSYDSWLKHYGPEILDSSTFYKLLLSYYLVLNNLTTTGIGHIYPTNTSEVLFTIITMLLGKIAISLIIGTILKMIYISEKSLMDFNMKYISMKSHLKDKAVSDYPLQTADLYLKNISIYSDGLLKKEMLEQLPYSIQQDLTSALHESQLRKIYIFKDINQHLLRQICTKIQKTVYFQNDYIVKSGEVNSIMYFIDKGNICVVTKNADHLETTHSILQPQEVFGISQGLNLEEYHHFCYRVSSLVAELLELKFDDWSYLLKSFPQDTKQIFSRYTKEYY